MKLLGKIENLMNELFWNVRFNKLNLLSIWITLKQNSESC